jgi:hypothetical protein
MGRSLSLRWRSLTGPGLEQCSIDFGGAEIVIEGSIVLAGAPFGLSYRIACDPSWTTRQAAFRKVDGPLVVLDHDGQGGWSIDGVGVPALAAARDVDLSGSALTNTLAIRRLGLPVGGSAEIVTAYVGLPDCSVAADGQRYTRASEQRYRYEALDGTFEAEIEVDADGLVLRYEGLFERIATREAVAT